LTFLPFFPPQERLSYIGPEEFVQAFVQKDPLDNEKVNARLELNKVSDMPQRPPCGRAGSQ